MHEYTVVALVRPWEVAWDDVHSVDSSVCVDWVTAESADAARSAFLLAFTKRNGLTLEDAAVVAVFAGRLTEGEPQLKYAAKQHLVARAPNAAMGTAKTAAPNNSGPALVTTKQFLNRHECFTMAWLRAALFNRETNGLAAAIVPCGRKILIDEAKFFAWLEAQQSNGNARSEIRPVQGALKGKRR